MNEPSAPPPHLPEPSPVTSWKKPALLVLAAILGCCALTAVGTAWWVKRNFYASALKPVQLSATEQQAFEHKLLLLEHIGETQVSAEKPVPAPEKDPREITLTDREINAFLAAQGVGDKVKINFTSDRVSANFILPLDPDFPVFGGTTLRFKLALGALIDAAGKLVLKVDDVTVGGIPLPNAWLGDIKGLDLIATNLDSDPVVRRFVEGIREFQIQEDGMRLRLNE